MIFCCAWYALCKPTILLNDQWNKKVGKLYMALLVLHLSFFYNVLFVDGERYIFDLCGMKFTKGFATPDE